MRFPPPTRCASISISRPLRFSVGESNDFEPLYMDRSDLARLFAFPTSIALAPGLVPQIFKGQISGRPLRQALLEMLATNGNVALVPSDLNLLALANRFAGRIDS